MQAQQAPPQFPNRALPSKAVLYRPLQDIDIYVEDEGGERFYTELLTRLIGDNARIATVIPLRGRQKVVQGAQEYSHSRPALFLIDGDLNWVAGLSLPSYPHLYVHPCYCVENYLFCEKAMIQIAVENSESLTEEEAQIQFDWDGLRNCLQENLIPLFVEFAVAFSLCPEIKTVSRGIGCVLRSVRRSTPPTIDSDRVNAVRTEVQEEVLKKVDRHKYDRARSVIESQIQVLKDPLDVVSGKGFLVPIQMFEVNRVGKQKVRRKSFVFRLARHCNLQRLDDLRNRLQELIRQNKAIESTA